VDSTSRFPILRIQISGTVLEHGYLIPFSSGAFVTHPVHPARPTWHLAMARSVDHLPYLFAKHRGSPHFDR
jgi:hypothetical protein